MAKSSHKEDSYEDAFGETFRVGVRPPPFWPEEPALWFAQMEGQFALANITTDATKFYHIVGQLDHRYAAEVKDIITKPPAVEKYEKLKTELIKRLSASKERKVKQLLMHEELGDRKPSQFLRHLEDLAGPSIPKDFLQTIWASRLPNNIQTVVASQTNLSLDELADLADKVHEIAPSAPVQVASAAAASTPTLQLMADQIMELTKQVALLSGRSVFHKRSQFKSRSRSRSKGRYGKSNDSKSRPSQPPSGHPHCWYHFTYGVRAKKCLAPCEWKSENSTSSRK